MWGTNNAVGYKEIFPLLREDKLWLGYLSNKTCIFGVGDGYRYDEKITAQMNDGMRYGKVPAISTFTNLDIQKRHYNLTLYKHYNPEEYPKYDNYDAINVDKVEDIPLDYAGVIGVPITFFGKYNPEQFEIVSFRKGDDGKDLVFTREREFNLTLVSLYDTDCVDDKKRRRKIVWEDYLHRNKNKTDIEPIDLFFPRSMPICGCMNSPKDTVVAGVKKYSRILIMFRSE